MSGQVIDSLLRNLDRVRADLNERTAECQKLQQLTETAKQTAAFLRKYGFLLEAIELEQAIGEDPTAQMLADEYSEPAHEDDPLAHRRVHRFTDAHLGAAHLTHPTLIAREEAAQ